MNTINSVIVSCGKLNDKNQFLMNKIVLGKVLRNP